MFCYNCVAQCVWSSHSKILISKTPIFRFPQSMLKVKRVSCSYLFRGSCNCRAHTLMTGTPISKYYPTDVLHTKTVHWFHWWNILILNKLLFFVSQQQRVHSPQSHTYYGTYVPCSPHTHPEYPALQLTTPYPIRAYPSSVYFLRCPCKMFTSSYCFFECKFPSHRYSAFTKTSHAYCCKGQDGGPPYPVWWG